MHTVDNRIATYDEFLVFHRFIRKCECIASFKNLELGFCPPHVHVGQLISLVRSYT